jgi:hypothetical protein
VGFVILFLVFSSASNNQYIERLAPLFFLILAVGLQSLVYIIVGDKAKAQKKKTRAERKDITNGFGFKEIIRLKTDIFTILLLGITMAILMWVPVNEILAFGGPSDHNVHVQVSIISLEQGSPYASHFFYHLLIILLQFIPGIDFYLSAKIIVTLGFAILSVMVYLIVRSSFAHSESRKSSLLTFLISSSLLIVTPISLFTSIYGNYYRGYVNINTYHNPTIILLKPFSIMVFLYIMKVFDEQNRPQGYRPFLISGIVTISSILLKPSYSIALLPALGLLVVYHLYKKLYINWRFLILAVILPSMLVLGWQFSFTFASSVESTIAIAPFELYKVLSGDMAWLLPKFILSIAFPLCVYFIDFKNTKRDLCLNFSWLVFFVGAFYTYFIVQRGPEEGAANFWWSGQIALFMLFLFSMRNFLGYIRGILAEDSPKEQIKVSFALAILGLHLISGVLFYSNHLNITSLVIK